MTVWTVEEFTPSDGSKSAGIPVDHTAWLRGTRENGLAIHVALNLASTTLGETEAQQVLDCMVQGLNAERVP